jgi:putative ABC transport system permease protein
MRSLSAYLRAFWRGLRRPSQVDADMNDEMRFHLEMEAQRIQQQRGLNPVEANRQAAIAFGGVEKYRGAGRDAFGFTWMRGLSVDLKLGLRMLGKSPGLTLVALFALSLAIGAGAAYLEFINDLMHGTLPVPEAERIVGIQTWDQGTGEVDKRQTANFVAGIAALVR